MNFLQPAYLWALSALAVPLAIHLLSRKEGKVLRMGSLRHVRETPTRQFRSLRLNEYLLLALRMIILGLLAFLLAGWYLENLKDHSKWLVMEPGLEQRADLKNVYDSLVEAGFERRWLQPGFPEVSTDGKELPMDYPSRLEELAKLPVEEVFVVATNRLTGFRGPLVSMPENVSWFVVDASSAENEVDRVTMGGNRVFSRTGSFGALGTAYKSVSISSNDGRARDTVKVIVAYDPEFETDRAVINAMLTAIKKEAADVVDFSTVNSSGVKDASSDWLIWLSNAEQPSTTGRILYVDESADANIIERVQPNRYRLTARLNSEVATSRNLTVHLMSLLLDNPEISSSASAQDRRVLPMQEAFATETASIRTMSVVEGNKRSSEILVAALLFFLLLERFIAYRNKQ